MFHGVCGASWSPWALTHGCGPQPLQWSSKIRHVMERFPSNRFCDGSGLRPIAPEHNDTRVMVFHRQAPIVLGLFDLANVLARLHATEWHIARVGQGMRLELLWLTG